MDARFQSAAITVLGLAIGAVGALAIARRPLELPTTDSSATGQTTVRVSDTDGGTALPAIAGIQPSAATRSESPEEAIARAKRSIEEQLATVRKLVREERESVAKTNAEITQLMEQWGEVKAKVRVALPNSSIAVRLDAAGREATRLFGLYLGAESRRTSALQTLEDLASPQAPDAHDPLARATRGQKLAEDYMVVMVEHQVTAWDLKQYLAEVGAATQQQVNSMVDAR